MSRSGSLHWRSRRPRRRNDFRKPRSHWKKWSSALQTGGKRGWIGAVGAKNPAAAEAGPVWDITIAGAFAPVRLRIVARFLMACEMHFNGSGRGSQLFFWNF